MPCKLDSTKFALSFQTNPIPVRGVEYFSNERGFSVDFSLKRMSLIFLLWKRNDSLVVL